MQQWFLFFAWKYDFLQLNIKPLKQYVEMCGSAQTSPEYTASNIIHPLPTPTIIFFLMIKISTPNPHLVVTLQLFYILVFCMRIWSIDASHNSALGAVSERMLLLNKPFFFFLINSINTGFISFLVFSLNVIVSVNVPNRETHIHKNKLNMLSLSNDWISAISPNFLKYN